MSDSEAQACELCGIKPARFIKLREITSIVLIWKQKTTSGVLCPVCAEAAYQRVTRKTGRLGWWGPLPFLATAFTLFTNSRAIKNHRAWLPHYKDADGRLANRPKYKLTHDNLTLALSVLAIGAFTLIGMNQFAGTRIGTISLATGNDSTSHFVDWQSVSIGDCLQSTGGLTVELSKCDAAHHWQVFAQGDSQSVSYDVAAISAEGDKLCGDATTNLDIAAINKINPAPVESVYYPSSPSWDQGDRTITCLIGSQDSTVDTTLIKP
jgi:hypothetical protein